MGGTLSDALSFLNALWSKKPQTTAIQLWRKSDQKTYSFAAIEPAVDWITVNGEAGDVYMAAGLAARESSAAKRRANMKQVVGIAGVWADIDVNGGPEGKTGAAKDVSEATDLAESLLQPTLLVNSGYGLQAWWLFEEVWPFYTEEDRDHAQRVVTGFQGALKHEAKRRGYTLDSTFDLARLMRVPGSRNHKGVEHVACSLLDDGGPRHDVSALEEVGKEFQLARQSQVALVTGEGVQIELNDKAQPDYLKLLQLQDLVPDFTHVWEHVPTRKTSQWSMSEYEFSITNHLVSAGWSDQEICDALVFHRNRYEPGDPKGKNRLERIAQTIGKVRATTAHQQEQAEEEFEREMAVDQIAALSNDAGLDPVLTVSLFNRIVGSQAPEIKQFLQNGRDYETARFRLALASGQEIDMGKFDNIYDQATFQKRFAVATGCLPKSVAAKKWQEVVQAFLKAAEVRESEEDTRAARAMEWVKSYCDKRTSTDKDRACEASDPFIHNEKIHLHLGSFHQYLRRIRGERIEESDLKAYLEIAGFERRTINYIKDSGKKTSRSYFLAPADLLGDIF